MTTPVLLDTDIGDDIDDALALALLLACPELDLRAITTVWGHTPARGRQARTMVALAGRPTIPVADGCGGNFASRPFGPGVPWSHADGWHDALARKPHCQDSESWPEHRLFPADSRHGVQAMIQELTGAVVPLTIGAMTNLAAALILDPHLRQRIPKVVAMAGEFEKPMAEWNIRCDPEAAHLVLASGIPVDLIPWSLGWTCTFTPAELQCLEAIPTPMAKYLTRIIGLWRATQQPPHDYPHLYDPLTIASLLKPEFFTWRRGRISVELRGEATYGFTTFTEDPTGPHRFASAVDRDAAIAWFLRRLGAQKW